MEGRLMILSLNVRGLKKDMTKITDIIKITKKLRPDFLLLQETHIDNNYLAQNITQKLGFGEGVFSFGKNYTGTAIIQISDRWEITNRVTDNITGRTTIINIKKGTLTRTLINIYAPAHYQDRPTYYRNLTQTLALHNNNIILAGDFNITLEDKDIVGTQIGPLRYGREELKHIIQTYNLKDCYRIINPQTHITDTTNKTPGMDRHARIDRVYVGNIDRVQQYKHINETLNFTDHKATFVTLNGNTVHPNKNPHWKFNDSLLENKEYITYMQEIIQNYTPHYTSNRENWDELKQIIKDTTIYKATLITKERRNREKFIQEILGQAETLGTQLHPNIIKLREELDDIQTYKYKGAQIRGKQLHIEEEKPTAIYLAIEQNKQKARIITQIRDTQGTLHTEPHELLNTFAEYYKNLFTKDKTDDTIQEHYLQYTKQLTDQQKENIDKALDINNIHTAIEHLPTDSTPGPDGLTTLFYKTFIQYLLPHYRTMLNETFEEEGLPESQNISYITLIPKDSGDPIEITNHRPISLLNVDYKILSKFLMMTSNPHVDSIIHTDQAYTIKGRTITDHNHLIRDILTYTEDTNKSMYTLFRSIKGF